MHDVLRDIVSFEVRVSAAHTVLVFVAGQVLVLGMVHSYLDPVDPAASTAVTHPDLRLRWVIHGSRERDKPTPKPQPNPKIKPKLKPKSKPEPPKAKAKPPKPKPTTKHDRKASSNHPAHSSPEGLPISLAPHCKTLSSATAASFGSTGLTGWLRRYRYYGYGYT